MIYNLQNSSFPKYSFFWRVSSKTQTKNSISGIAQTCKYPTRVKKGCVSIILKSFLSSWHSQNKCCERGFQRGVLTTKISPCLGPSPWAWTSGPDAWVCWRTPTRWQPSPWQRPTHFRPQRPVRTWCAGWRGRTRPTTRCPNCRSSWDRHWFKLHSKAFSQKIMPTQFFLLLIIILLPHSPHAVSLLNYLLS